ncbi:MAG: peptidylprolyl isomerase [Gemmatimonadaceae bacterium]
MLKPIITVLALFTASAAGSRAMHAQLPFPETARATTLPLDRIVAIVGDEPILWTEVLEFLAQRQTEMPQDSAGIRAIAAGALSELVDEEVLVQRAAAESIVVADADVRAQVDDRMSDVRSRFATDEEFRSALAEAGLGTPAEYRSSLSEQVRRVALQQQLIAKMRQDGKLLPAGVTEQDVTEAFERARESLPRRPATVGLRQIVVAPSADSASRAVARAHAESLLVEIRAGGDFEQIARRESMDEASRQTGGDLGWQRRGTMVPEFERWMFALAPGQLSPVVETVFGYHIIKVDRAQPAEVKARHILIRPDVDSADVQRAAARADSVVRLWREGVGFDSLLVRYHDPDENQLIPAPYPRDSLPRSYQTALTGLATGDVAEPFPIENPALGAPKFVILQLTDFNEGGEYTVADLRDRLRRQLAEERAIRRLLDRMREETYVSIRL